MITSKRQRERMGKRLRDHLEVRYDEGKFRDLLNQLHYDHCPSLGFVAKHNSGVEIQSWADTFARITNHPFWKLCLSFAGERSEPLVRVSTDGTAAGEMFVWNLEVVGFSILNAITMHNQSIHAYFPLALIPMGEKVSTIELFLSRLYRMLSQTSELDVGGGVMRKAHYIHSDDGAAAQEKHKLPSPNARWFCSICTKWHDGFKVTIANCLAAAAGAAAAGC
jgi:hypothetical protein